MTHVRRARLILPIVLLCLVLGASFAADRAHAAQTSYVVQPNDTLSGIALRFGTTVSTLMSANGLTDANRIVVGQVLTLCGSGMASAATTGVTTAAATSATYTVQSGDTLSAIGQRFGVSLASLAATNGIANPALIAVGTRLVIPAEGGGSTTALQVSTASATSDGPAVNQGGYIVQAGDTLSTIGSRFGLTAQGVADANNIGIASLLSVGQHLAIPAASAGAAATTSAALVTGGGSIGEIIAAQAEAAGVSVSLIKALAWQESGWQMVTASDGGMGVMQLMPDTVTWVSGALLGYRVNPYDATDNIRAGVAMMRYYLNIFGDVRTALAAYHQGMTSVQTEGIRPDTQLYIGNILALQQRFSAGG